MKRLALLATFALVGCQTVADLPPEQQHVQVVHETKLAKGVVYTRTLTWFASTFTDSKAVLEVQDKDSGIIMGKGIIPNGVTVAGPIPQTAALRMTIKVEIEEGKYRTTYDTFMLQCPGSALYSDGQREVQPGTELDTSKDTAKKIDASLAAAIEKDDKF